ncbi:MAG: pilus assembly protein TadG-related protein [Sphingomonas sp.]
MFKFLKKLWRDRRGNALVIAAASLPLIVGSAGLAVDTMEWTVVKRQLQRAADSAALAGVYGKLASQTVTTGSCTTAINPAIAQDLATGSVSTRLGTTPTCAVQAPPTSGLWTAASWKSVKVTISASREMAFSGLFLSTAPTITASATAAMVQNGKYCMISMDNNVERGIDFTGTPNVNLGCGLKTNARGANAIDCGGNSVITATPVAAVGQITPCSNFGTGTTFQNYAPPQTDPYGTVPAPTVPSPCNQQLSYNGQTTSVTLTGTSATSPTTVCYTDFTVGSGKTFTGTDLTIIINKSGNGASNGNLNIQGTVDCNRCVFVLTSSDSSASPTIGNVDINAGAHLTLHAPTNGTYAGILIYQDRRSSSCGNWCNHINGDSTSVLDGAIYMPKQEVQINGGSGMTTNCLQTVAWRIQFSGNTSVNNNCTGSNGHSFDGYMVRLVE